MLVSPPAQYRPYATGRYSVAPGLQPLSAFDGSGPPTDSRIFQLDREYQHFIRNKAACRQEAIGKYYVREREQPETMRTIVRFVAGRLASEYPDYFDFRASEQGYELTNHLRSRCLRWTPEGNLTDGAGYESVWDGLADQVPEDLAIWQVEDESDYISTIHLCAPNHWDPAGKVGRPFSFVHAPVAGMETLRRRYRPMLLSLLQPKSWVRFAWGLSTDRRLNHHPLAPPGVPPADWAGRSFDPGDPQLYVRVERQTLTGFPEVGAVLFTIRTYFDEVAKLSPAERKALRQAVNTMAEATLQYKGLGQDRKSILEWLDSLPG